MISNKKIRNVAIIAHVDHGSTTLVDQMLRKCGQFRAEQLQAEHILESNAPEREPGTAILGPSPANFHVSDRRLPLLAVLSGKLRRAGYEPAVGEPKAIRPELADRNSEPIEYCALGVPSAHVGPVMGQMGPRCGLCNHGHSY